MCLRIYIAMDCKHVTTLEFKNIYIFFYHLRLSFDVCLNFYFLHQSTRKKTYLFRLHSSINCHFVFFSVNFELSAWNVLKTRSVEKWKKKINNRSIIQNYHRFFCPIKKYFQRRQISYLDMSIVQCFDSK